MLAALPIYFFVNFLNNKNKDKNLKKVQENIDNFNKENNTSVKLINEQPENITVGALADFISGNIALRKIYYEDLIFSNISKNHVLQHELSHIKQYILMACSENGIQRMNYIVAKRMACILGENAKKELYEAYKELQQDSKNNYKNIPLTKMGYDMNLSNYITAMYKLIFENETKPENIPMIINETFYNNAKSKRGKLTPEEEKKAQVYLAAFENYPKQFGIVEILNPNSTYNQNPLEKEAYKIPWYAH